MFGFSPDRRAILNGLLDFRASIYAAGIPNGFQWLNGSFMEDVESHQDRSPNDIDVVSFIQLPFGEDQGSLYGRAAHLFDHDAVKVAFKVDAYFEFLGVALEERHIRQVTYWHSMWAHNRNGNWKGFFTVGLDLTDDAQARQVLQDKGGNHET